MRSASPRERMSRTIAVRRKISSFEGGEAEGKKQEVSWGVQVTLVTGFSRFGKELLCALRSLRSLRASLRQRGMGSWVSLPTAGAVGYPLPSHVVGLDIEIGRVSGTTGVMGLNPHQPKSGIRRDSRRKSPPRQRKAGWATLYNRVGVVKRHVEWRRFLSFPFVESFCFCRCRCLSLMPPSITVSALSRDT